MQRADPTREFFEALAARGHEPLLGRVSGTIRVDVLDGKQVEYWHVAVNKGDVKVSRKNRKADAVVSIHRSLCDAVASGEENAMAAMLRGALVPQGDLRLVMQFQRLFPGPPRSAR